MQGEGLKKLQSGQPISTRELLLLIAQLSWPAILAQISSVVMQYIDTAMVGQLGSNASAAIGVVATTSWLFGDLCIALTIGFNVAVAQALGARQSEKARGIMKLAFLVCMAFSLVMMAIALGITGNLPRWLRADPAIWQDASAYFLVYVLSLPFMQLNNLCGGLLRSAGNMKTPGICMVVMCLLDVVFNAFLIFPSGTLRVLGVTLPGFGLGVLGASMGTALSQVVIAVVLVYILLVRSPELHLRRGEKARFTAAQLKRCLSISAPVMGERTILSTARMVTTAIVAPLGIIATAANSFAITAESLCYMSAFGVPEEHFTVDLTIARGLDYYTGTVYETVMLDHPEIGSVCSGGRYDNLAEYYTDRQLPGAGISIGLTRLFYVLGEQGMLNPDLPTAPADVLILPMTEDLSAAISLATLLRENGIRAQLHCEEKKFKQKIAYADKLGIPYVIFLGEDEISSGVVACKDMATGEQTKLEPAATVYRIKAGLAEREKGTVIQE